MSEASGWSGGQGGRLEGGTEVGRGPPGSRSGGSSALMFSSLSSLVMISGSQLL